MKIMLLSLVVLSNFFSQPIPPSQSLSNQVTSSYETSNPKFRYTDNQSKSFIVEDEFYNKLDKNIYEEYKNATYNFRKKISFKDVPDTELIFNRKTNLAGEKMNLQKNPDVHPNRQVYFMASFYQNEKEEFHNYIVIDAETKLILLSGNHHWYHNPY
jgi:hypothetical protein